MRLLWAELQAAQFSRGTQGALSQLPAVSGPAEQHLLRSVTDSSNQITLITLCLSICHLQLLLISPTIDRSFNTPCTQLDCEHQHLQTKSFIFVRIVWSALCDKIIPPDLFTSRTAGQIQKWFDSEIHFSVLLSSSKGRKQPEWAEGRLEPDGIWQSLGARQTS